MNEVIKSFFLNQTPYPQDAVWLTDNGRIGAEAGQVNAIVEAANVAGCVAHQRLQVRQVEIAYRDHKARGPNFFP